MNTFAKHTIYILLTLSSLIFCRISRADDDYDMGTPTLREIWVDPVNGLDRPGRGSTRALALKSISYAWAIVPSSMTLNNTGFHILLAPGKYTVDNVPSEFQSVFGTVDYPVIFEAADDTGSVIFPSIDVTGCNYIYFIGVHITLSQASYTSIFRGCDHLLFRKCQFISADPSVADIASFSASVYQCQYIYFEQCEFAYSSDNAINIFASQYGHIKKSSIHHAGGNGIYFQGGVAYFSLEENTINNTSGSGIKFSSRDTITGLDQMAMPWVHYEVYDIKCFNNIIHHTSGAGFSCSGGYNILFAQNTLYQTGLNNSLVVLSLGKRCRGVDKDVCQQRIDSGAWGTWYFNLDDSSTAPIPNKNIFIYNNIFNNSSDSVTASSHLSIHGPITATAFNAACPKPAFADDNVQIKGNIIWNGKSTKALGIATGTGCGASNPSCNEIQLLQDNMINSAEPKFVDAATGNFHPVPGGTVFTIAKAFPIPNFSWTGLPPSPIEPPGNISNSIVVDRDSNKRDLSKPVCGAFIISTSSVSEGNTLHDEISHLQNYPNPAQSLTTISFHLREGAYISLDIYNMLGEKLASLISETLDEGDHNINWNSAQLPSGKYFYRLSTRSMTITKQMTIVR